MKLAPVSGFTALTCSMSTADALCLTQKHCFVFSTYANTQQTVRISVLYYKLINTALLEQNNSI